MPAQRVIAIWTCRTMHLFPPGERYIAYEAAGTWATSKWEIYQSCKWHSTPETPKWVKTQNYKRVEAISMAMPQVLFRFNFSIDIHRNTLCSRLRIKRSIRSPYGFHLKRHAHTHNIHTAHTHSRAISHMITHYKITIIKLTIACNRYNTI